MLSRIIHSSSRESADTGIFDGRPTVVVVAHQCPFPPVHGNRARFVAILRWLKDQGYRLSFVLQALDVDDGVGLRQLADLVDRLQVIREPAEPSPASRLSRNIGRIVRRIVGPATTTNGSYRPAPAGGDIDAWCWPATELAVKQAVARDKPFVVIAEYALLAKCLEDLPSPALRIIDTVEVFFRNQERFHIEGLHAPLICTPPSERAALGRADILIAIQRNDAQALREALPEKSIITLPHPCQQPPRRVGGPTEGTVLFVGSGNPFNVHGLRQFLEHAWPSIARRVPHATLRIVGALPPLAADTESRIVRVGELIGSPLQREYQTAHVVINPQVAGTGLKIKCVEALSAGCPLVTNKAGADGLEGEAGQAYLLATDWADFANHVVTLLTDTDYRLRLEARARAFAEGVFSPGAAFAELAQVLDAHRPAPSRGASRGVSTC